MSNKALVEMGGDRKKSSHCSLQTDTLSCMSSRPVASVLWVCSKVARSKRYPGGREGKARGLAALQSIGYKERKGLLLRGKAWAKFRSPGLGALEEQGWGGACRGREGSFA